LKNAVAKICYWIAAKLQPSPILLAQKKREELKTALDALNAKSRARQKVWDMEETALRAEYAAAGGSLPPKQVSDWLMGQRPTLRFSERGGAIVGRYDTALTTDDNREHWAMADALAADAQANPMVRYVLRNRARYEVQNNGYARGIGKTIVNDTIGRGPRLHIDDERLSPEIRGDIERKFHTWGKAVKLATKMRTMRQAEYQDGEVFAEIITNPKLNHPIKLDLRPIESDQVRFVDITLLTVPSVDGIRFDDFGNPTEYHILRVHPGYWSYATGYVGMPWEYDKWDANFVIHNFTPERPGQHRGVPEVLTALPLLAVRRRLIAAILDSLETAADFSVVLETEMGADNESTPLMPVGDHVPLERRMGVALPAGYKANQIKPEQPTHSFDTLDKRIIAEIGRGMNVPYNVAACDSSDSNFASGRLDYTIYYTGIDIRRSTLAEENLDRLFREWTREAVLLKDKNGSYIPAEVAAIIDDLEFSWHWDGHEMGNPEQLARAREVDLATGSKTLPEIWAEKGKDWRRGLIAEARALGLSDDANGTALQKLQAMIRSRIFTSRGDPPLMEADLEEKELGLTQKVPLPSGAGGAADKEKAENGSK
jgi:capsid protein